MQIDNNNDLTHARSVSSRFQRFLEISGNPFSVRGDIVKLVALPHVLYQFLPDGIFLTRPNSPERRIGYKHVNFDQLLRLAHHLQEKKA